MTHTAAWLQAVMRRVGGTSNIQASRVQHEDKVQLGMCVRVGNVMVSIGDQVCTTVQCTFGAILYN